MSGKRFRYALEPLRLTRQWALDELLTTLAACNGRVAEASAALRELRDQLEQARQEWLAGQVSGQTLALERFALLGRYLHDGATRKAAMERQLALLEQERDEAAVQVAGARRALDAVEEHRDGQRDAFRRLQGSADFKLADDHWSVLQAKGMEHELDC